MSYKEDRERLNKFVGCRVTAVRVAQSYDDFTEAVVFEFENGYKVSLGSRGFHDCSSCVSVDVD